MACHCAERKLQLAAAIRASRHGRLDIVRREVAAAVRSGRRDVSRLLQLTAAERAKR